MVNKAGPYRETKGKHGSFAVQHGFPALEMIQLGVAQPPFLHFVFRRAGGRNKP
jgi:hypothetical protein